MILNVVSNFLSPKLHTVAIFVLAGVEVGEPCAGDDLETLKWFPFAGSLPKIAFKADVPIIERYQQTKFEEGLPTDPDFARGIDSK